MKLFTISKHRFVHCLTPVGLHGNGKSCSYISAGFPFGCSLDPRLNCPVKNTPQLHGCSLTKLFLCSIDSAFSIFVLICCDDSVRFSNKTLATNTVVKINWFFAISIHKIKRNLMLLQLTKNVFDVLLYGWVAEYLNG